MKKELLNTNTISNPELTPTVVNRKINAMIAARARLDKHIADLSEMIEKKYDTEYTSVDTLIGDLLA